MPEGRLQADRRFSVASAHLAQRALNPKYTHLAIAAVAKGEGVSFWLSSALWSLASARPDSGSDRTVEFRPVQAIEQTAMARLDRLVVTHSRHDGTGIWEVQPVPQSWWPRAIWWPANRLSDSPRSTKRHMTMFGSSWTASARLAIARSAYWASRCHLTYPDNAARPISPTVAAMRLKSPAGTY
jgi:hypothetical protein